MATAKTIKVEQTASPIRRHSSQRETRSGGAVGATGQRLGGSYRVSEARARDRWTKRRLTA